jgi:hypothetical protein
MISGKRVLSVVSFKADGRTDTIMVAAKVIR